MSFKQKETEHQRRMILTVLASDAGYAHNEVVLIEALEMAGHTLSSDKLKTELYWLKEQGLIDITLVMDLIIAKLTQRGLDAAKGASQIPGIARKGL